MIGCYEIQNNRPSTSGKELAEWYNLEVKGKDKQVLIAK